MRFGREFADAIYYVLGSTGEKSVNGFCPWLRNECEFHCGGGKLR